MDLPDHDCVPRWWPHHIGDTCRCDTCGHCWVCDTADRINPTVVAAGLLDGQALGWRTA